MNISQPLVSVLITVYNGMPYIVEAVQCLQDQSYENIEIIIIDDGSVDDTKKELQEISKLDNRIQLINSERIGRGKALNLAIRHSSGEYLAINDADDFSYKTRIEKQVDFLNNHKDHALVGSMSKLINLETGQLSNHSNHRPSNDKEIRKYFLKGQPIQHVCVLMRKKMVVDVGGYNEKINFLYDRDLFINLASKWKLHNIDEVLVNVGHHPNRFFYNTYKGKERIKLDFHYRFKAAKMIKAPFKEKLNIWLLFQWSLLPIGIRRMIKKIVNRK